MSSKGSAKDLGWVYWGTLISSLGTFTFPGATIGILTQQNFPLWQIGVLMGVSRLGTLLGSLFLGDLSDKYETKRVVIGSEILAFFLTILLIYSWHLGKDYFYFFSFCVFLRFIIISVGGPGRNKLVKTLSDEYKKNHFHTGVALNVVTYGPGVVGSFLGFISIKYLSYDWVLVFDALTFIISGYILLVLVRSTAVTPTMTAVGVLKKLSIYFSHKRLVKLDILLALPFMGTNVLMSRLSGGIGFRVPLLLMTFGLAVFISSPLLKISRSKLAHIIAYGFLLFSFLFLGYSTDSFFLIVLGVTVRNISYWYLYNLYTGTFQEKEPQSSIASLFAARLFIGTAIIGVGELIFGFLGASVSLQFDLGLRAFLALIALAVAVFSRDI